MSFFARLRHLADPFGAPAGEGPAEGDRKAALGRAGEEAATTLLRAHGMRVLARNWRSGPLELDLVCREGDTLVFVEVKTRGPGSLGSARDAVGPRKRQSLIRAARAWLAAHDQWHLPCRFDLVCIEPGPAGPHMEHIRHAFDLSGSGPSVDSGHASWQPW